MERRERRPISKGFQKMATRIKNEKIREELYKSFNCMTCSRAIRCEYTATPKQFKIRDPSGTVTGLVIYRVVCTDNHVTPFEDSPDGTPAVYCRVGNDKCQGSCQNCKYSEPLMIGLPIPYKIARRGNTSTLTISRIVYRCTNVKRMEHFDSGTVMSSYICCRFYESKEE